MDNIRAEVADLQLRERAQLDARIDDINVIRLRDDVAVAIVLVVALGTRSLAWFLFRRSFLRRVDRLTACLRDRREGIPSTLPEPTERDQTGELERALHLLDRHDGVTGGDAAISTATTTEEAHR